MIDLRLLTAKDVAEILGVSLSTAKNYIKDIKQTYGLKTKPTMHHLQMYLGV